jgi:hypothetical protein
MRQRLLAERGLAEPDRPVVRSLELAYGRALLRGGQRADGAEPDADAAETHSTVTVFARFRG